MSGQKQTGFTVVELLIVIVVIGVLAGIVLNVVTGVQMRARDTERVTDINATLKALKAYKAEYSEFPAATPTWHGAWEASTDDTDGFVFMEYLVAAGYLKEPLTDPVNTSFDGENINGMHYNYYTYAPDSYLSGLGCATDKGKLAILMIVDLEAQDRPAKESPGFSCSGRNWNNEGDWVWGGYDFD